MNTKPETATIIEVAQVKTSQGLSTLTKCWNEEKEDVISLWNDKPSPFLKGKRIGDSVRVISEIRKTLDINGNSSKSTRWTIIPDAPKS